MLGENKACREFIKGLEGEKLWKRIFDSINDGISIIDKDFNVISVNSTMERLHHDKLPLVGRKCYYVYHGNSAPCQYCPALVSMKDKKTIARVIPREGPIAGWQEVYSFPILDDDGNVQGAVHYIRDVTERKKIEDELRDSEEKFRVLAETSPIAIMMHQGDSFIYVNRAAEIVLGYSRERLLNMRFWEPFHPDYQERAIACWKERAQRKNSCTRSEIKIVRGDGQERWAEVTAGLIDYRGKPTDIITISDITERKQAEEALQEAKTQAELYVDLMSHDINNLNQVGIGFLEMAMETLGLDERGREIISKALRALEGSTRLIENVKKLQKVRSGRLRYYPIDIGETLGRVKEDYSHMPGNSVTINYSPVSDCYVIANELLYDVFSNIVSNAIKYSVREPVIDIIVKRAYDGDNLYYKVSIEDNGPGIPDELKARLFKRQLGGDKIAKGSGIGLYLVKTLVNSYHGRVWAEDRVYGDRSRGSRFVVMLPAAKPR